MYSVVFCHVMIFSSIWVEFLVSKGLYTRVIKNGVNFHIILTLGSIYNNCYYISTHSPWNLEFHLNIRKKLPYIVVVYFTSHIVKGYFYSVHSEQLHNITNIYKYSE